MIFTRFECPRCQHVFIQDGAADAFADCPKCQSMALAIGEATSAESGGALPQLSIEDPPSVSDEAGPPSDEGTVEGGSASSGVFSGLLGESGDGSVPDVTHDDMKVPATLEQGDLGGDDEEDPFNEATRQVNEQELPASVALTRGEAPAPVAAAGGDDDFDPFSGLELPSGEDDIHLAPTDVLRPAASEPSAERTEVLQNPLGGDALDVDVGDDEDAWENGPPPAAAPEVPAEDLDEDAWENGPPPAVAGPAADEDLDEDAWENGPPPSALPRPPPPGPEQSGGFVRPAAFAITHEDEEPVPSQPSGGGEAPAPFDSGFFPSAPGTNAGAGGNAPLTSDEFQVAVHEEQDQQQVGPGSRQGAWDPNFASGEMGQEPVLLSSLEGQMDGSVQFQDPDAVGLADAFSQLEAAFDGAASAPEPPDKALQMAQEALRQAQVQHSHVAIPTQDALRGPNVPAPPGADEPPVMRRARQRGHLTLSEEAKALAGIPIQPEAGSQNLALELTRGAPAQPPQKPAPVSVPGIAPAGLTLEPPAGHDFDEQEVTDPVSRPRPVPAPEPDAPPGTFRGFTALRILGVVVLALLIGLGVGAATAPAPEKKPVTSRDRAEQKFARGNRFYEEGRIDDALGEYRGALTLDPTLAPAHRAKAAALAKLQRHEEAARAYYKYLEVAPSAVDAGEVREVLARWEGKSGS